MHSSHSGRDKTWAKIKSRYYFRGGETFVRGKIKECLFCSHKHPNMWPAGTTPLQPIPVVPKPMWRIHLDLMGPFPKSQLGNKYVAVGVCALTKYPEAKRKFLISTQYETKHF